MNTMFERFCSEKYSCKWHELILTATRVDSSEVLVTHESDQADL